MKRPSFQFYPDAWLNDLGLRRCSVATRGVWIDLMCHMQQGEPYGHLRNAAGNIPLDWLAGRIGMPFSKLRAAIAELETQCVFSRTPEGTIYSRRMVRDNKEREDWVARQKKTRGCHSDVTVNVTHDVTEESREMSRGKPEAVSRLSSSSSPSPKKTNTKSIHRNGALAEAFEGRFWPAVWRKVAKPEAFRAWPGAVEYARKIQVGDEVFPEDPVDYLVQQALAEPRKAAVPGNEWRLQLHPATWLRNHRWEDEVVATQPHKSRIDQLMDTVE